MTKFAVGDKVKLEAIVCWAGNRRTTISIGHGDGDYTNVEVSNDDLELVSPGPAKIGDLVVIARGAESEVYTVVGIDDTTLWLKAPLGTYRYEVQDGVVVVERA